VHVVWVDPSLDQGHSDIFYSCSGDGGKSWTKPRNLSQTPGIASQPVVAVDRNDHAHVAWLNTEPSSHRSDMFYTGGAGDSWTGVLNVSHSRGVLANLT